MSNIMNDDEIDPELKELLDLLRPVPERTPEATAAGRAKFIAELDAIYPVERKVRKGLWSTILVDFDLLKEKFGMKSLVFRTFVAILAVLVLVLGGAGMTAQAAAGALPGDALYGVKTGLEQARLSLTNAADAQVRLYLELANRRLEEMDALVEAGRYTEVAPLAEDFHNYVSKALEALKAAGQDNPVTAAELNAEIAASLARFSQVLNSIFARLPETVQPALLPALKAAQGSAPAVGDENANGNANDDNSNGNANDDNSNGNANDDNSNGNANGNADDDNSNGNANGNADDDNSNGNANGNADDDNSNGNANGNADDDNSNGNANGNSNGDDSNGNGDDGGNDNGGKDDDGKDGGGNDGGGNDDNGGGGKDDGGGGGGNDDGGSHGGGGDSDDNSNDDD